MGGVQVLGSAVSTGDVMRMAREAGLPACHLTHPKALQRFAVLVSAAEREACAKVCEDMQVYDVPIYCAAAIRAKGPL